MTTPGFVQRLGTSSTREKEFSAFTFYLPEPTLSGNCVAFGFSYADGAAGTPVITVDDDSGGANTWVAGPVHTSGTDHVASFYCLNVAAGTRAITIHAGTNNGAFGQLIGAAEFYNIALSSAADGSNHANGSSATWSPGAFSTSAANSLVVSFAKDIGGSGNGLFTLGSGFSPIGRDTRFGGGSQYKVLVSAGSIDAAITYSNSSNFIAIAFALKTASAGTVPSAEPRLIGVQWLPVDAAPPYTTQFKAEGTHIVAGWVGGNGFPTTLTLHDDKGNAYRPSAIVGNSLAGGAQVAVVDLPIVTGDLTVVVDTQSGRDGTLVLYDLQFTGAKLVGHSQAAGVQHDGGNLTTVTHTPIARKGKGIVFMAIGINSGALRGLIGSAAIYRTDQPHFPEGNGGGTVLAEDNGWGHLMIVDLSDLTAVWDNSHVLSGVGNGVDDWGIIAAEIAMPDFLPDYSAFPKSPIALQAQGLL